MKKFLVIVIALFACIGLSAQNEAKDNIIGEYYSFNKKGDKYKVRVSKSADGTYTGLIFWANLKDGKVIGAPSGVDLDLTPSQQIVLFSGLKYNEAKQHWSGTKIYDPIRKIRANMRAEFSNSKTLKIRGSLAGISETVTWQKIK